MELGGSSDPTRIGVGWQIIKIDVSNLNESLTVLPSSKLSKAATKDLAIGLHQAPTTVSKKVGSLSHTYSNLKPSDLQYCLEVFTRMGLWPEAVVTNHLVVRGSYRSLTLVVYGNTAEDLGQFNIDVELDSSLANLVYSSSEGKLEDLPPALRSTNMPLEESISSLKSLPLPVSLSDLSSEMMEFLHLIFKNCQIPDHLNTSCEVVSAVVAVVSSYVASDFGPAITICDHKLSNAVDRKKFPHHAFNALLEATNELHELYKCHQPSLGSEPIDIMQNEPLEPKELADSQFLVYLFNQHFALLEKEAAEKDISFYQNRNMVLRLGVILLLCSARDSCFWFVNSGGMEHIAHIFSCELQRSAATTLLLLCVVEQATRHAIGCEGFLGWWPREDGNVPLGNSDGYCHLLSLLMQKQRHDVASLATYILHRLRSYEIAARFESAVLSLLTDLSADRLAMTDRLHALVTANSQLKNILKLLNLRGPIEEPSPVASAKLSALGQADGPLSYKATVDFITSSKNSFSTWDIDTNLLSLLKERGFLPLSAALLSSSVLRSASGSLMEMFMDIAASIELILLSLLCCRSGLTFLLSQPEATATLIFSLQGIDDSFKAEYVTLRHAAVLISKGFFCRPQEIGMIAELHLRVGNTIDRLLVAPPHSEEQLWVLWELFAISRSDSGRQALLAVGQYPQAVSVLIQALRSFKNSEAIGVNTGSSPLSLAIFHFAAEIIEVIIMDSNATSLASWIGLAADLHKALHSSSPGFNRKDAPTRVLEWIDAGVVYHRNGVIGLLRYAAVLASGGDAHFSSGSVLVSDSMDIENVLGDSSSASDSLVVDNLLGKLVSDKYLGVPLHSTSVVQLTTTFRILAFVSENSERNKPNMWMKMNKKAEGATGAKKTDLRPL
ncbi:hypothetical protein Taro_021799 [Colocasia esculenta]|uniref:Virilizer N-terminal domain-containing protein n=1 Tax=Colocasia esculenta TaxID=4460 RepID=A0A843V008_COLES|nr:hypothetical protein [Colocasia esculenta]